MNALQTLHYGKAFAVGVTTETAPPTMEQTANMPGVYQTPPTYHGGGTPAIRPGDILPSAFRDHGLVLCRQWWCRWSEVLACRPCILKVCVCVRVCVPAFVRACVRACVRVCVCVFSHHMGHTIQRQQQTKGVGYSYTS